MTDAERIQKFAEFLALSIDEFKTLAIACEAGSRATLERILGSGRTYRGERHTRSMAKLANVIEPKSLEAHLSADSILTHEVVRQLMQVDSCAWTMWRAFLTGEEDKAPDWESIHVRWESLRLLLPNGGMTRSMRAQLFEKNQQRLLDTEQRAAAEGVIAASTRREGDLLRWSWTGSTASAELWLRMRSLFHWTQLLVEAGSPLIYIASPVLSFALLDGSIFGPKLADGRDDSGEASSHIKVRIEAYANWFRNFNNPRGRGAGFFGPATTTRSPDAAAAALLSTCAMRNESLWNGIWTRTQTVVAMFDESQTRVFFESLQDEERNRCADRLGELERRGLVLLATKIIGDEEQQMRATLSVGGDAPAIAVGFPMARSESLARHAAIARAGTDEYKRGRAYFDDIANSGRTQRLRGEDVRSLILPERTS